MRVDWAEVYRSTYRDLVRFLYRKVWDADRAADLAQEVFVRALDHSPDRPRAWLFAVASNLARDEARGAIRRRRHLELVKGEAEAAQAADAGPDPIDDLERTRRTGLVREALEGLSERDREVLLLWQSGLSYREIADQTGLAIGAMGTTLARARTRLVDAVHEMEKQETEREGTDDVAHQ
ncbi:MAG: sigma-70 family RNA polymerase sigma factor [Gemmatimonadota bacterium]|jgi:RNA polymerase sigma factor (sigma-70 family)